MAHVGSPKRETITVTRELIHVETVLGDHPAATTVGISCSTAKTTSATSGSPLQPRHSAIDLKKALDELLEAGDQGAGSRLAVQSRRPVHFGHRDQRHVRQPGRSSARKAATRPSGPGTPRRKAHSRIFRSPCWSTATAPRQRNRLGLFAGSQAGGGDWRADLGQRKRAKRDRAGRRNQALKLTTASYSVPAARTSTAFPMPRRRTNGASCPIPGTK